MLEPSDATLVERARAGDRAAFDELVARHDASLRALLLRYLRNPDDAREAAQDTFLRAFQRLSSFRGDAPFKSWLLRVGVNVALSRLRVTSLCEPQQLTDDALFTTSLGTTHLVAAEMWRKVGACIERLSPRQRLVVELRLFHELTFAEIGAIVASTEDAAKMNFHHGIKRLRELLSGSQAV